MYSWKVMIFHVSALNHKDIYYYCILGVSREDFKTAITFVLFDNFYFKKKNIFYWRLPYSKTIFKVFFILTMANKSILDKKKSK